MHIAIGVDGDGVAFLTAEGNLWGIVGLKAHELSALLGLQIYPLDMVLRLHGMRLFADLDCKDVVLNG